MVQPGDLAHTKHIFLYRENILSELVLAVSFALDEKSQLETIIDITRGDNEVR
jgi:hypothetical protein